MAASLRIGVLATPAEEPALRAFLYLLIPLTFASPGRLAYRDNSAGPAA